MRVETIRESGPGTWVVGLCGLPPSTSGGVPLTAADLRNSKSRSPIPHTRATDEILRIGIQAYSLGIAYEFDPYFGLSISRVDPLPHQLEAVYDYPEAGARPLPSRRRCRRGQDHLRPAHRELKLRGLAERILIVCPANLAFQWQRELKEKFDEKFMVLKGDQIREQFGINQWLEHATGHHLARPGQARRRSCPACGRSSWDLVIVDEAHRMSWTPPSRKTARYALGELLRDSSDHLLLLTATPHKGDPANFSLFLQLLDEDAYADVKSIREAMDRRRAPFYLRRTKEAMVYFPQRQPDGTWEAKKIFTKRIPTHRRLPHRRRRRSNSTGR